MARTNLPCPVTPRRSATASQASRRSSPRAPTRHRSIRHSASSSAACTRRSPARATVSTRRSPPTAAPADRGYGPTSAAEADVGVGDGGGRRPAVQQSLRAVRGADDRSARSRWAPSSPAAGRIAELLGRTCRGPSGSAGRAPAAGPAAGAFVQVLHLQLAEGAGPRADLAQFVQGLLPDHGGGRHVHQEQQPGLAAPVGTQDRQDQTGLRGPSTVARSSRVRGTGRTGRGTAATGAGRAAGRGLRAPGACRDPYGRRPGTGTAPPLGGPSPPGANSQAPSTVVSPGTVRPGVLEAADGVVRVEAVPQFAAADDRPLQDPAEAEFVGDGVGERRLADARLTGDAQRAAQVEGGVDQFEGAGVLDGQRDGARAESAPGGGAGSQVRRSPRPGCRRPATGAGRAAARSARDPAARCPGR
ncbi:hypothetical protein STENM223S_02087 [Streptomyces tendae]